MSASDWSERQITIAGAKVHVSRSGKGRPLLVLHHDIGTPDQAALYDTLAKGHDVIVPHHPGWGKSERPQWLRSAYRSSRCRSSTGRCSASVTPPPGFGSPFSARSRSAPSSAWWRWYRLPGRRRTVGPLLLLSGRPRNYVGVIWV